MRSLALVIVILASSSGASATNSASGTLPDGSSWQVDSLIVGKGSTNASVSGYAPTMPRHGGVSHLTIQAANGITSTCSGALMADRIHVVTAAHCLSKGPGTAAPLKTTVRFSAGSPDADVSQFTTEGSNRTLISASSSFVHPNYTGQVVDQNDIAVLRLSKAAPSWVQTYDLATDVALGGQGFEVAGYGLRSTIGGAVGSNFAGGKLRVGQNDFDFRLGDPSFGGLFTRLFGTAPNGFNWLADFDSGLSANDASCIIAGVCGLGRGSREAAVAPGDSGGPAFVAGRLAALTSFGLSFGRANGDVDAKLNSSFGEFSGFVPVSIHSRFLTAVTGLRFAAPAAPQSLNNGFQSVPVGFLARAAGLSVPEPDSWLMLILGFGLTGAVRRRQRQSGHISPA
jgi:Trypsin/PEP-CTERM motif